MDRKALTELLARHGKTLQKRLGQNFLIDEQVFCAIRDAVQTENVLEIGAGVGWLTAMLCEKAARVVTVEIDQSLAPILAQTVPYERFTPVYADILKTDLNELIAQHFAGAPFTVVGNLPYYITSAIVEKLMRTVPAPERAVIMVQAEFADRLLLPPGHKNYRALGALVNYFYTVRTVCEVPRHCFMPAPHVDSRVIELIPRPDRFLSTEEEADLIRFVKDAFSERRKKMTALAPRYHKTAAEFASALEAVGLSPDVRCERLSGEQFAKLYKQLFL